MIDQFKTFLKSCSSLRRYTAELKRAGHTWDDVYKIEPRSYVTDLFTWESTPDGYNWWDAIDYKWHEIVKRSGK